MYYNNFEGNYIIDMTIKKNGKIESCKKKIPLSAGIKVVQKVYKELKELINANNQSYGYFRDCLNSSKLAAKWPVDKYDLPCAILAVNVYCYKDGIKYDLNKNLEKTK